MSVLEYFKKLCRRLGGIVKEKEDVVSCVVPTEAPVADLVENVEEFYRFVERWGYALDKPVELSYENKLLGGWSENADIVFDPNRKEFTVYLHLYSEHGISPEEVEDTIPSEIERKKKIKWLPNVEIHGEASVSQNPVTDDFAGEADVWIKVPMSHVSARPSLLADVVGEASKFADELIEEAEEKLIIPVERW